MTTTFDLTTSEGRVAFDAYLWSKPGPKTPFARHLVAGHTGPKRRIEVGTVDVLVPETLANEVLQRRRAMMIPATRIDAKMEDRLVQRWLIF
jgi:hypothetical protein